jgi:predicted nucleotidyltransferase
LSSSVLRWPDASTVIEAARAWAAEQARRRPEVVRVGYFGSYSRGDWGVGSDLDLVVVVERTELPFERRGIDFPATNLPVPADVLVYSLEEWKTLAEDRVGFYATLMAETVWLIDRAKADL